MIVYQSNIQKSSKKDKFIDDFVRVCCKRTSN